MPPVRVLVEELEPPVSVDREGITEVDDGGWWWEDEIKEGVEAEAEEEGWGRAEEEDEEEGGWCSRRNLILEAVRKQEMYEVKKRSTSLRYLK